MFQSTYHPTAHSTLLTKETRSTESAYDVTQQMLRHFGKSTLLPQAQKAQGIGVSHLAPNAPSTAKPALTRTSTITVQRPSSERMLDKLRREGNPLNAHSQVQREPEDQLLGLREEVRALQQHHKTLSAPSQPEHLAADQTIQEELQTTIRKLETKNASLQTEIHARAHFANDQSEATTTLLSEQNAALRQEIKALQESLRGIKAVQPTPLLARDAIHPFSKSIQKLEQAQSNLAEHQANSFALKRQQKRYDRRCQVLTDQLASLEKTHDSLLAKQKYCDQEIKKYQEAVRAKKLEDDETREAYEERRGEVNALIEKTKDSFKTMLTKTQEHGSSKIKALENTFTAQETAYLERLNKTVAAVENINQSTVTAYQTNTNLQATAMQTSHQNQLVKLERIFGDYWRYVNDGVFSIYNTHHNEYLYAADYEPFDDLRRRVFTWQEKVTVIQGFWQFKQQSDGRFAIYNTHQSEYLYAADHAPHDDKRRSVFTWRKGTMVKQGDWRLEPANDGCYRLFNLHQKEYLYASDIPFDGVRRHVFTWREGCTMLQGDWRITKVYHSVSDIPALVPEPTPPPDHRKFSSPPNRPLYSGFDPHM